MNEGPKKNGPFRTRWGHSASLCKRVPEGGTRTPTTLRSLILNPARLPIPPLRQVFL